MDTPSPSPDADPWHAALAAAFGAPVNAEADAPSVLERLAGSGVSTIPRVLREPEAGADARPVRRSTAEPHPALPSRYRVVGELGRGGMGVVWQVHDVDLGRDVALKVLRDELTSNPDRVRRFVEEAQITGQLAHPGIVPLHELGADAGRRPWFAMRLVHGETLARRLSRRANGERAVASLLPAFEAICQTLAYAHARGVVHRDVKPSNVILGAFGEVQVLDWGLAKTLETRSLAALTRSGEDSATRHAPVATRPPDEAAREAARGTILGTPGYMSPEQARGDADAVDERADVFALGAILCEILTGAPPVRGERDVALATAARGDLSDAFARLDACAEEPELAALARRCLDPAPSSRPRDASAVAGAIAGHRTRVDERARAIFAEAVAAKASAKAERRSRRLVVGLVIGGAATIVAAVISWASVDRARAARADAVASRVDHEIGDVEDALARGDVPAGVAAARRALAAAQGEDAVAAVRERAAAIGRRASDASETASRAQETRRRDAELLDAIETAREEIVALSEGWYPYWSGRGGFLPSRVEATLAEAFRIRGIDVRRAPVTDVAQAVRASAVREELVAAIDMWAWVAEGFDRRDARLDAVCRELDTDPVRGRLRDDADLDAVRREAGRFDAATGTPAQADLIAALLHYYALGGDERLAFLRRVSLRRPDDYLSTFRLGLAEAADGYRGVVRATRLFAAATALRPRSAVARAYLGLSLRLVGDVGAGEELRRALEEDPTCWEALAASFDLDAHRGDEAACLRRAEVMARVRPATPDYLVRAADAAVTLGRLDEAVALLARAEVDAGLGSIVNPAARRRRDWLRDRERLAAIGRATEARREPPATPDDALGAAWLAFSRAPRAASDLYEHAFAADPTIGEAELPGAGFDSTFIRAAEAALRTAKADGVTDEERASYRERGRRSLARALARTDAAVEADPNYAPLASVDFWSTARNRATWPWLADAAARARLPASEAEAWTRLSRALDDTLARCRR